VVTETQQRMDSTVKAARLYAVPVELVMPCDMLHNWRRRTKRLDRAHVRAIGAGDRLRATAIRAARRRLYTGRLTP
jgi:hypothetical protein